MNSTRAAIAEFPVYLRKPMAIAAGAAALFLVACTLYIIWSDRLVARVAGSSELELRLQTGKGILFVAMTSTILFLLSWTMLRRIARDRRVLVDQQQALIASERRAAAGLLAHSIAHDMNNVLTVGMANVELLRSHAVLDTAGSEMLRDIGQSFERLHEMTRRMSRTGQRGAGEKPRPTDLAQLVRCEIQFLHRHRSARDCAMSYQGPDHLLHTAYPESIQELVENLLINAADATGGMGRIEVHLSADERAVTLEVHDNGPGIPPERRAQVFEPLFTTKPNGMGLGLQSVKAAAKLHQGRVEVGESPLGGARFRVILPITPPVASA